MWETEDWSTKVFYKHLISDLDYILIGQGQDFYV